MVAVAVVVLMLVLEVVLVVMVLVVVLVVVPVVVLVVVLPAVPGIMAASPLLDPISGVVVVDGLVVRVSGSSALLCVLDRIEV